MLRLRDVFHLPQLESAIGEILSSLSGLILIAGLNPPPLATRPGVQSLLPSGRSAILGLMMTEYLLAHPHARAVIISEERSITRPEKAFKHRVRGAQVGGKHTYEFLLSSAASTRPDIIVVDQVKPENAQVVMEVVQRGQTVLSQIDTLLVGEEISFHLLDMGVSETLLDGLSWVIAVQRYPALCPRCKQPDDNAQNQLETLTHKYPHLTGFSDRSAQYYRGVGCPACHTTGRFGEVSVFDIYRAKDAQGNHRLLPLEEYMFRFATSGQLAIEDVYLAETNQRRRLYHVLTASTASLNEATADLKRRLVELQAANLVLEQRTQQLMSLESFSQALIATDDLGELADQVCRRAQHLCGADYAILYYDLPDGEMEILAVNGWEDKFVGLRLNRAQSEQARIPLRPHPLNELPPGIQVAPYNSNGDVILLRAGLSLPLMAHDQAVGLMIVQSSHKERFTPGESALLQTFANQSALAVQRAGLLRARIQHERIERELELARQVQQSMLPQEFPSTPGYRFAALNRPARWVGGDFYDAFLLEGGRVGIVIGDASGKGMASALNMALTRSLIQAEARRSSSTEAVLRNVNRLLLELGEIPGFITVFFAILEAGSRRITYTRAGHDLPYLLRGMEIHTLGGVGSLLGVLADHELSLDEQVLMLQPGDRLVLFTDGLTDVVNDQDQFFGQTRFYELLHDLKSLNADELCEGVFSRLDQFRNNAEQYDDMTLFVLQA